MTYSYLLVVKIVAVIWLSAAPQSIDVSATGFELVAVARFFFFIAANYVSFVCLQLVTFRVFKSDEKAESKIEQNSIKDECFAMHVE